MDQKCDLIVEILCHLLHHVIMSGHTCIYHSYTEISGHLTKRYIPLLYLNAGGFFMCNESAFPGYIAACIFVPDH